MLREALTALMRSADAGGVLVVGGLLTLLTWVVTPAWIGGILVFPPLAVLAPLALAPAFVARGYFVRALADAAETGNVDGAMPFVAWNDLYRDGLKSALLSAILLFPLALLFGLVALAGAAVGVGSVDPAPVVRVIESALGDGGVVAVVGLGGGLLAVVSIAYLVAFAYVRPAALAAFATSGRLRDGLRPKRVSTVAASGEYATAWVVATATLAAGYALSAPFVPLLIGVVFVFVTRVVVHALYGRGAVAALGETTMDGTTMDGIGTETTVPIESRDDTRRTGAVTTSATSPQPNPTIPTPTTPNHTGSIAAAGRPEDAPQRSRSEAPPAVQAGRTVPLGSEDTIGAGGGEIGAEAADVEAADAETVGRDDADSVGFEWSSDVAGRLESDDSGTAEPRADSDAGFEWVFEDDGGEDKS